MALQVQRWTEGREAAPPAGRWKGWRRAQDGRASRSVGTGRFRRRTRLRRTSASRHPNRGGRCRLAAPRRPAPRPPRARGAPPPGAAAARDVTARRARPAPPDAPPDGIAGRAPAGCQAPADRRRPQSRADDEHRLPAPRRNARTTSRRAPAPRRRATGQPASSRTEDDGLRPRVTARPRGTPAATARPAASLSSRARSARLAPDAAARRSASTTTEHESHSSSRSATTTPGSPHPQAAGSPAPHRTVPLEPVTVAPASDSPPAARASADTAQAGAVTVSTPQSTHTAA